MICATAIATVILQLPTKMHNLIKEEINSNLMDQL